MLNIIFFSYNHQKFNASFFTGICYNLACYHLAPRVDKIDPIIYQIMEHFKVMFFKAD